MSGRAPLETGSREKAAVPTDFVEPAYGRRSLADVLPAIAAALGVRAGFASSAWQLPPAPGYVLFLVDGLGFEQLCAHPERAPFLHSLLGTGAPATAGVPSTTATSLTSLATALTPGTHGVVGFTSRVPGTEKLLNALDWSRDVDPVSWQPHPTGFERLSRAGVNASVVSQRGFEGTGLTVAGQRGARFVGADKVGERLAAVRAAAVSTPSLTYTYEGDLDWTGHRYGVASAAWESQLEMVDAQAQRLRESLPEDVRLLVVSDHGMVDSRPSHRVDVDDEPDLAEGVLLVGGEARLRHLYAHPGAGVDVVAAWRTVLGDRAEVLLRDEAVERGWFGAVGAEVRPRIGDVVVASRGDFAVLSSSAFPHEANLVGLHGSLTRAEMLIPVLVA